MDDALSTAMAAISSLHGRAALTVLVLGDPRGEICHALASAGHDVVCCPDHQRWPRAGHQREIAGSLEHLLDSPDHWDVVVATAGFRRIGEVRTAEDLDGILTWLADHARHALIEAPRNMLAPDLHDLGPYDLEPLGKSFGFVTEVPSPALGVGQQQRPLIHASRSGLLLDSYWIAADELDALGAAPGSGRAQTFRAGEAVVKVIATSPDYGERDEPAAEAHFLACVSDDIRRTLSLPSLRHAHQGRAVTTVVRDGLPGRPPDPHDLVDRRACIPPLLDTAALWASTGLFHNDLRPWNLLWDAESIRLIDFADAGPWDLDVQGLPQVMSLAATIGALATTEIRWGDHFIDDVTAILDDLEIDALTPWCGDPWFTEPWFRLPSQSETIQEALGLLVEPTATEVISTVLSSLHPSSVRDPFSAGHVRS